MLLLLGISSLISLAAALVLGIRLLRLAAHTRGVPELAMGASFLLGGFLGFLFILIGNPAAGVALPVPVTEMLFRLGMSLISVGLCFTYIFVWQTFRPGSSSVRGLTLTAIVCILASLWAVWSATIEEALVSPLYLFGEAVRMGGMVWGCIEALHYHVVMRRRLALGLADPVVTNRFLLWGIAMGAGIITALTGLCMTLFGMTEMVGLGAWPYLVLGIFATISPVAQWFAFFPPRGYCEWVQGSAVEAS
ncbi:MAG: hypothetical protein JRG80_06630 [Deltaproteobacteria bacterium]|nr:hypothetical protein [Deltaproteobacteria bacterium]MBW2398933.1 hypothetical protein [Deltaproteobacteria bacterium]MBW2665133.1 hypothetical protein [Deltaproteobacteria bacterium]